MHPRLATMALAILTAILLTPGTLALLDADPPEGTPATPQELDDVLALLPGEEDDETDGDDRQSGSENEDEEDHASIGEEAVQEAEQAVDDVEATVVQSLMHVDSLLAADEDVAPDETAPQDPDDGMAPASAGAADVAHTPESAPYLAASATAAALVTIWAAIKHSAWSRFIAPAIVPLFSRFDGPTVLEHPRRAELHGLVCRTPGITVPQLCEATGLSRNTVLHHLRMLGDQDMVVQQRQGRTTHWFENGGRYGREHKAAYAVLHDSRSKDVARYIRTHPGSTQGQVSRSLGLAPSVVHWHMKRLEDAELVQRRRDGRTMQCFPGTHLESLTF